MWAMFAHLSALAGHLIPFGNIIGPLVIWMMKRDEFPLVSDQGKESLNFQISITIYLIVSGLLVFVIVGFITTPIIYLFAVIATIVAAVKANEGVAFRYPLCIRFIS